MGITKTEFGKHLACYILSIFFTLAYSRGAYSNDVCYITNIGAFLEQCPTLDPAIDQILSDFTIKKDGVEIDTFPCVEPISALPIGQYTDELILLQELRTIYYVDKDRSDHLPWTTLSLYDWLKSKVGGFNIDSSATVNSCCEVWQDGTLAITRIASDESNREHDRTWEGIAGNIGLIMHEVRHVDGFPHVSCCPIGALACDERYDETNLSPYGIQYWLNKSWVDETLHTGFTCLPTTRIDEIKSWLREGANAALNRFCEDAPSALNDTNNPIPPCDSSCAPDPGFIIDPPPPCDGFCGGQAPAGCFCDNLCVQFGNCCPDSCQSCGINCEGDANQDGMVTSADITCVTLGIFGMLCPNPDCNQDGSVTSADITCVIIQIFNQ